jgi:hypothetical protein
MKSRWLDAFFAFMGAVIGFAIAVWLERGNG